MFQSWWQCGDSVVTLHIMVHIEMGSVTRTRRGKAWVLIGTCLCQRNEILEMTNPEERVCLPDFYKYWLSQLLRRKSAKATQYDFKNIYSRVRLIIETWNGCLNIVLARRLRRLCALFIVMIEKYILWWLMMHARTNVRTNARTNAHTM